MRRKPSLLRRGCEFVRLGLHALHRGERQPCQLSSGVTFLQPTSVTKWERLTPKPQSAVNEFIVFCLQKTWSARFSGSYTSSTLLKNFSHWTVMLVEIWS